MHRRSNFYMVILRSRFCDGGDLLGLVKSQSGKLLDESYVLDLFVQLALALKHVHDRKIIHRDIKTENIFLSSHKRVVKLGDFGIAKVLENTLQQARTAIGTPYYLSPEICQGKLYNFKSDIWSLGVVLYELCALRCPFAGANMKGLMLCISKGTYAPIPASFSSEMRKLIADMLNLNAKLRPSINDLLRRPILQQRISKLIEGSVLRQEFSHTVLHGQHYSKSKCPNHAASPAPADVAAVTEQPPSSVVDADRRRAAVLKHVGRAAEHQVDCPKAHVRAASDAKGALMPKPQLCQANVLDCEKAIGNAISEKLEREKREKEAAGVLAEKRRVEESAERERSEKAAAAAEKAERDRRDRELARILAEKREIEARIDREKRERELARHRELHQQRIEKQADAAIVAACCLDRAQEDRVKQKKQQILALEDFRQRQAKQWLGGAALVDACIPVPADLCLIRKDVASHAAARDAEVAVAKRLWSAKSPAPNSVDQVKARGAAQKIEEQQKYEQALAVARKQAFLERVAAEDRRQRELHCALHDAELLVMNTPAAQMKFPAAVVAESALSPACERSQPVHSAFQSSRLNCGSPSLEICAVAASAPIDDTSHDEASPGIQNQNHILETAHAASEASDSPMYAMIDVLYLHSSPFAGAKPTSKRNNLCVKLSAS
jgi:hypothetical protein